MLWVPVRHHSPAAARATVELLRTRRPEAVLIEGPSDVTDLSPLLLEHQLPISQMSWARWTENGTDHQSYALYPFTVFSAEWQAIRTAAELGIETCFIDLPWADQLALRVAQRPIQPSEAQPSGAQPSEAALPGTDGAGALQHDVVPDEAFYRTLADYVGREDLASVWDEFFEIAPLDPQEYLLRATTLGAGLRQGDPTRDGIENLAREHHMAGHIRAALTRTTGEVMVITGAFHTAGLQELLAEAAVARTPAVAAPADLLPGLVTGHALVASSYEELDADHGYLAGQPSPGFYDHVFSTGADPRARPDVVLDLYAQLVNSLRARGMSVSVADSIAALTTAQGLQQIRGHARLWRDDLVDGITAAVVKDDLTEHHPLVEALALALRGSTVGRLAPGAQVPPLVEELARRWDELGLPRGSRRQGVDLDLTDPADLERSRLLHLVATLDIPAAHRVESATSPGATTTARTLVSRTERWQAGWHHSSDSAAVLASRWGGGGAAAAAAVLQHRALNAAPDELAEILSTSVAIGLDDVSGRLARGLESAVRASSELPPLGRALDRLLGFVHFDTWLGTVGRSDLTELTLTTQQRMVDVLAQLPAQAEGPHLTELNLALRTLAEATGNLGTELGLDPVALDQVLVQHLAPPPSATGQAPVRHTAEFLGGLQAARWLLSGDPGAALEAALGDPVGTGQFYSGLLTVAGHLALAAPQIFDAADEALTTWHGEDFLSALPDLRRAMTRLTRRERDALLRHLTGSTSTAPTLAVSEELLVELAGQEQALESRIDHWLGAHHG